MRKLAMVAMVGMGSSVFVAPANAESSRHHPFEFYIDFNLLTLTGSKLDQLEQGTLDLVTVPLDQAVLAIWVDKYAVYFNPFIGTNGWVGLAYHFAERFEAGTWLAAHRRWGAHPDDGSHPTEVGAWLWYYGNLGPLKSETGLSAWWDFSTIAADANGVELTQMFLVPIATDLRVYLQLDLGRALTAETVGRDVTVPDPGIYGVGETWATAALGLRIIFDETHGRASKNL